MNRRDVLLSAAAAGLCAGAAEAAPPVRRRPLNVLFMLGEGANVIDTAGPWEVFQDAMISWPGGMHMPFRPMTVARTRAVVEMTGGMKIVPAFGIDAAPSADVVVIPAQRSDPTMLAWLTDQHRAGATLMSVCTGAFQLGRAGLLNGLAATTHHDSWDSFAREFPAVTLRRGPRFVDEGRILTAAGLTSGIDAALHLVARACGAAVATDTARMMEYRQAAVD